jgi:predicted O-methyltransferase YrrM
VKPVFAWDIASAVFPDEIEKLCSLAEDKTILEVGAEWGRSTVALASVARMVYSVDCHLGADRGGDSLDTFWKNIQRYKLRTKVIPIVGFGKDIAPIFKDEFFDLLFLDADHRYESVRDDIGFFVRMVKPGGWIAFHDYGVPHFGVTQAVEEFAAKIGGKTEVVRSLAVLRKP